MIPLAPPDPLPLRTNRIRVAMGDIYHNVFPILSTMTTHPLPPTAPRLCQRENVGHSFQGRRDHAKPESFHGWTHQLGTLFSMMAAQASGVPTANHGLFHRWPGRKHFKRRTNIFI